MPITPQASKKMRRDRRRTAQINVTRNKMKKVVKVARKSPGKKTVAAAFKALDKAAKHHLIHPNKAARLKSRLVKLLK